MVQVVKAEMTEQEAFELEEQLILHYGIDNLTNQTLGGYTSTGYRHTEETRKLQSEIGKARFRDNPVFAEHVNRNISSLHDKQRNDAEYKKRMSQWTKDYYISLTEEEKREITEKKSAEQTPERRMEQSELMKQWYRDNPEYKEVLSKRSRDWWNTDSDIVLRRKKESAEMLTSPEVRAKQLETAQIKVVINRRRIVQSCVQLNELFNNTGSSRNSLKEATRKGYVGTLYRGYLIEYYDENNHPNVSYDAEVIPCPFLSLPRYFSIIMDDCQLFLSPYDAARFVGREGDKIRATGDWLSAKARNGEYSLGHTWRVATIDEVNEYIVNLYKQDGI